VPKIKTKPCHREALYVLGRASIAESCRFYVPRSHDRCDTASQWSNLTSHRAVTLMLTLLPTLAITLSVTLTLTLAGARLVVGRVEADERRRQELEVRHGALPTLTLALTKPHPEPYLIVGREEADERRRQELKVRHGARFAQAPQRAAVAQPAVGAPARRLEPCGRRQVDAVAVRIPARSRAEYSSVEERAIPSSVSIEHLLLQHSNIVEMTYLPQSRLSLAGRCVTRAALCNVYHASPITRSDITTMCDCGAGGSGAACT